MAIFRRAPRCTVLKDCPPCLGGVNIRKLRSLPVAHVNLCELCALWSLTNALCTKAFCHVNILILHFMYPVIIILPQNHWKERYFKKNKHIFDVLYKILNVSDFRRADIFFTKIVSLFSEQSLLCLSLASFFFFFLFGPLSSLLWSILYLLANKAFSTLWYNPWWSSLSPWLSEA